MHRILSTTASALAAAILATGCRSTSTSYQFTPSPLEILVTQSDDEPILARVLVGIPGAERENGRRSGIPELLVRLRIENESENEIRFDPAHSTVLGPDLAPFGQAKAEPPGILKVPAGRAETLLVRYPFPQDGSLDAPLLTGVNLRFELDLEGRNAVEFSATLERLDHMQRYNSRNSVIWGTGWRGGWGPGLGSNWGFGYASSYYGCW